jgi:long-subunit acyl-CoA synthetase (AMP-forming)
MDARTRTWLLETVIPAGIDIYSTYGMTEAAGRISVLSPEEFAERSTSVGRAVRGGRIELRSTGEIVYTGPNVMMGYARTAEDLQLGDSLEGELSTGDLGVLDAQGYLQITGRMDRVCKLLDTRIDLDEVEAQLSDLGDIAVVADGRTIAILYVGPMAEVALRNRASGIAARLRIPSCSFRLHEVSGLSDAGTGKRSYGLLRRALK